MNNKLIMSIVGIAIGIILVGSVLAPVVSDATSETLVYYNSGTPFQEVDGETHQMTLSMEDSTIIILLDGEPVKNLDFELYGSVTILIAENSFLRLNSTGQLYKVGPSDAWDDLGNISTPMTVLIEGDVATVNNRTLSNVSVFASSSGDYVMSLNPKVIEDSTIIYAGTSTWVNTAHINQVVIGTLNDLTFNFVRCYEANTGLLQNATATYSVDLEPYSGDLVELTKINETVSFSNSAARDISINYVLVPSAIEYDNPNYSPLMDLASVLPMIMILAILISAVGIVARKRD